MYPKQWKYPHPLSIFVVVKPLHFHYTPTLFCISRSNHEASTDQNSQGSEQLCTQIPAILTLNDNPTDRAARKCRDADPHEDKRDPHALLERIVCEFPDNRVVQPLHRTREEPVEASNDRDTGVARGADPGEQEDGRRKDARDDRVDWAEEAV